MCTAEESTGRLENETPSGPIELPDFGLFPKLDASLGGFKSALSSMLQHLFT